MCKHTTPLIVPIRSVWQAAALGDDELEQADLVELNLAVAAGVPSLADMEPDRYVRAVDGWTSRFAAWLPGAEATFRATPSKWNGDVRFFRAGMLAGFLGHEVGLRYIEDQKHATAIRYTDPADLFLNGLIDTKHGTCASLPTLHVAIARRLGWPVSLACARGHLISRFDDSEVVHNVEMTSVHPGAFCSDTDEAYVKRFELPRRAIDCGSDLRRLTAREMLGVFVALRARHFADVGNWDSADRDFALARALFPAHRSTYVAAMVPLLRRGAKLFDPDEVGHPDVLRLDLAAGSVL
jgi:hypothetical protein